MNLHRRLYRHRGGISAALLVASGLPAAAQTAVQAPAPAAEPERRPPVLASEQPDAQARGGEPNVKRTVIEDNGSRIDELRVRGQTQRITVTPKIGPRKPYAIIMGDASRDSSYGTGGARDAVGKRVWDVLDF